MTWLNNALIVGPHFCLCLTESEFHEKCEELEISYSKRGDWLNNCEDTLACVHSFTSPGAESHIVAFRPAPEDSLQTVYARLVHEAVHIWQFFCAFICEHNPSREFEAYSIQAISLQLFNQYTAGMARLNPNGSDVVLLAGR